MKRLNLFKLLLLTYFIFQASIANAAQMSSVNTIYSFTKAMAIIKSNANVPVLFPTIFPKKKGQAYFANPDLQQQGYPYYFYVDSTIDCGGAHYCNIGMVYAQKNTKPEINYNLDKKKITKTVLLTQGIVGYYTPGYALADYHPPQLQWYYKKILYTLVWDTEFKELMAMANSAIAKGAW